MRAATFEEAKSWEALFKLNTLIVCCTFCDVYPCNKRVGVENRQVKKKVTTKVYFFNKDHDAEGRTSMAA